MRSHRSIRAKCISAQSWGATGRALRVVDERRGSTAVALPVPEPRARLTLELEAAAKRRIIHTSRSRPLRELQRRAAQSQPSRTTVQHSHIGSGNLTFAKGGVSGELVSGAFPFRFGLPRPTNLRCTTLIGASGTE